jgi:hypothetical protein
MHPISKVNFCTCIRISIKYVIIFYVLDTPYQFFNTMSLPKILNLFIEDHYLFSRRIS